MFPVNPLFKSYLTMILFLVGVLYIFIFAEFKSKPDNINHLCTVIWLVGASKELPALLDDYVSDRTNPPALH